MKTIIYTTLVLVIIILIMGFYILYQSNQLKRFKDTANISSTSTASSEISACTGIDEQEKDAVAYHRILLAKSSDGLNFTKLNKVISDRASVPDLMIDKEGNLRIYFIQVSCKEQNLKNNPVVAISSDSGKNWQYQRLTIEAPKENSNCQEPGGNPPPVDPDVVLLSDGTYRLYATCPSRSSSSDKPNSDVPMTFVYTSTDGLNFSNPQATYIPEGKRALDPVVLKTSSLWHLYNGDEKGGSLHATSKDGISFEEKDSFCPFTFTAKNSQSKCYIIGDALALADNKYRLYLFGNTPDEGFKSIVSSDGENWTIEQDKDKYILSVDNNSEYESKEIGSPSVVKLKDGSFLMAYETVIPGAPNTNSQGNDNSQFPASQR